MALTLTKIVGPSSVGNHWMSVYGIAADTSYTVGGYALVPTDLGMGTNSDDKFHCIVDQPYGYTCRYDYVNQKLLFYDGQGEYAYAPGGGDVKGATAITAAMGTADQGSDAVNAGLWWAYQTFTTINGAAGVFGTVTAQPAFGRNAVVTVKNDSGGSLNLYTGTMTITIVGKFRGKTQTEAIACTLTAPQVAVVTAKYRAFAGAKPFDSITSATIDATSLAAIIVADGGLKIAVGPGVKIGFPVAPGAGADTDVLSFSVNAAARSITNNSDYTNQTFNVGTIADGDDLAITYKIAECGAGTDLSAVAAARVTAFSKYRG